MKKVLFLLVTIGMIVTTVSAQELDDGKTITFMNCVECMDYFEWEVNTDKIAQLVLSCRVVPEVDDPTGIRKRFYDAFPEKNLPGVTSIFLMTQDDEDVLFIILRKDIIGETCDMYLLMKYGWLRSVDMQEFYYFDELLWLSKYGKYNQYYHPREFNF